MSTELATIEQAITPVGDPEAEVEWASRCAKALVKAITANPQLTVKIGAKDYIKAEGWQTLGAMTKVDHIDVIWCREYTPPNTTQHTGWEVRVEVRDRDGNVRGTGEAMCVRQEKRWATADEFAIRSMAQTRALGKAYRMALSYVVALAGYEPTPAEEMPQFEPEKRELPMLVALVVDDLNVADPSRNWTTLADKAAQNKHGKSVYDLTVKQQETLVADMRKYLETITADDVKESE